MSWWWWAGGNIPQQTLAAAIHSSPRSVGIDFAAPVTATVTKVYRPGAAGYDAASLRHALEIPQDPATGRGVSDVSVQEQLNAIGSGSFTMRNDSPDWSEIRPGDLVRFVTDGVTIGSMIVKSRESSTWPKHTATSAPAPMTTYAGDGLLSVLDDAPILPSVFNSKPVEEERGWGPNAVTFDDSGWHDQVTVLARYTDHVTGENPDGTPQPTDYAHTAGVRVAPVGATTDWYPRSGYWWVRYRAYCPYDGEAMITGAGDDSITLWFDGQLMFDSADRSKASQATVPVSKGWHQITMVVMQASNPDDPAVGLGPTWAIASAWQWANGQIASATPWWHVGMLDTARALVMPAQDPSMTIGQILCGEIDRLQSMGWLPSLGRTFSEWRDSNGRPWPVVSQLSTKVGYRFGSEFVLDELAGTWVDVQMWTGALVLDATLEGDLGRPLDIAVARAADEDDPRSGAVISLAHTERAAEGNTRLVQSQAGWHLAGNPGDAPRSSRTLKLGAYASKAPAVSVAHGDLGRTGRRREEVRIELVPGTLADARPGDRIDVPLIDGTTASERIISITRSLGDDGRWSEQIEVKDRFAEALERIQRWMSRMASGTSDGTSSVAQPSSAQSSAKTTCCPAQPQPQPN